MPLLNGKRNTINDIYTLPQGQRAELIDGEIFDLAAPSATHQRISMFLSMVISNYISSHEGDCEAFAAPYAVFLNDDEYNYVEPDISVICDPRKLDDKGCHGAPDWIIEIVSPASRRMDYMIKLFKYRSSGVREYWIVDPDRRMVRTYDFSGNDTADYGFGDKIPTAIYSDLEIVIE